MHLGRIIPNKYKHRLEAKIRLNRVYWDNIMLLNMSISRTKHVYHVAKHVYIMYSVHTRYNNRPTKNHHRRISWQQETQYIQDT